MSQKAAYTDDIGSAYVSTTKRRLCVCDLSPRVIDPNQEQLISLPGYIHCYNTCIGTIYYQVSSSCKYSVMLEFFVKYSVMYISAAAMAPPTTLATLKYDSMEPS